MAAEGAARREDGDRLLPAVGWLLADMGLVLCVVVTVKALDGAFPAVQVVFLRCLVGLALISPIIARLGRAGLRTHQPGLQVLRVGLNAVALTANFHAVASLPLATATTINFTRPFMLVVLAVLLLGERPGAARWLATGIGFAGVMVIAQPWSAGLAVDPGLLSALLSAAAGSGAVIAMRRSAAESPLVLMVWYTAGMAALTALPAVLLWEPVGTEHLPALLAIGAGAQLGQYCFIRAHRSARVASLAPLGYLSLVLSVGAGWLLFGEVPTTAAFAGMAVIVAGSVGVTVLARDRRRPGEG